MSQPIQDTTASIAHYYPFKDKEVDNDGFFNAMEEELPHFLSIAEVHKQARLELQKLISDMKKQTFIRGTTEWTAIEQKNFFEKVELEVMDVGAMMSSKIREKIQLLIEDEIWRELNDDGKKYSLQDGDGNTMIPNIWEYQNFLDTSFLLAKETTIIPLDLRLTVSKTDTIESAKQKLDKYQGKYNALVLLDLSNRPIGVISVSAIEQYKKAGHTSLEGIPVFSDAFGYYATPNNQLKKSMQKFWINILPIVDSTTGFLIGILTGTILEKKEVQYYSTASITRLTLEVWMNMRS